MSRGQPHSSRGRTKGNTAQPGSAPLIQAARLLARRVGQLHFATPISHVYNPLDYAWPVHAAYLQTFGQGPKQIVFLGMNPGPYGMMQTGVPFGEIAAVRDWMKLEAPVNPPVRQHPKRPIEGFQCRRSEVSGRRLWGLFADRFQTAPRFFQNHFVVNYCPLAFLEESGRNFTPDKLPSTTRTRLQELCDAHLEQVLTVLQPEWAVGVGEFAFKRLGEVVPRLNRPVRLGRIAHPSPASPAANKDWPGLVTSQLTALGIW